ncbi:MAG: DUF815 domain-containing protein [Clostridiales bacterium]|nr:DUF815 domain-containing protein [Clostridiales bacterium]
MSDFIRQIGSLALFRGVIKREPLKSLLVFLKELDSGSSMDEMISSYSEFVSNLYKVREDGDLSAAIWDVLVNDMNPFLKHRIDEILSPEDTAPLAHLVVVTAEKELDVLSTIGRFNSYIFKEQMMYDGYLPDFKTSDIDIRKRYMKMIESLDRNGYGIFADNIMFKIKDGEIIPVKHPDPIRTEELFCYERQREKVISNTKAFVSNRPFADVLLYGDAGTGKSSTVKAVARSMAGEGVRLVELPKSELYHLPDIIDHLSGIPMKFILFMDDISFCEDDDRISSVKSVLEGAASGNRRNVVIYATSNRRHMIKESVSSRGDEMHMSDTIAEQMSLSERFGLRVLFDKPNKQDYLTIVENIMKLRGLQYDPETTPSEAEKFAIRAGGRSARVARQFVDSEGYKNETVC